MKSTIQKELREVNGIFTVVPKEYPNYCGLSDVGFIWHNEWSDPELEYKGKRINIHDVEDTMYERMYEETGKDTYEYFSIYLKEHTDDIYELSEGML